jgi:uncharacterized protein YydD (DUF2326 family)
MIKMTILKKNFNYFNRNRAQLVAEHEGKYVVIHDCSVYNSYDNQTEAYLEAVAMFEAGSFIVQFCAEDITEPQIFHSRVLRAI